MHGATDQVHDTTIRATGDDPAVGLLGRTHQTFTEMRFDLETTASFAMFILNFFSQHV